VEPQAEEDFRSYVAARSPALLRTAYLLTGQRADAEDLLQTALAKTYLSWDRIRDREALDGYVRRVLVNTHTSIWRRRKLDERPTDVLPERAGRDATADSDLHDALWAALAGLPRRQRATVVLRYYEDLSEAATAEVLGVSVGTVKSTTSRALTKLRTSALLTSGPDDPRTALPFDGVPA
jgi:RNA polymerase sigma-70 factor (sigma-E family)